MIETTYPFLGGVPLDEIETLVCRCDDGVSVAARRRADLPWPFIFMGRQVRKICDCLGGRRSLGFQALVHVIGEGMTVAAWSLRERGAPWRLNNDSAMGAFKCALAAIVGFYGPDLKRGNLRVRQRA